MPQRFSEQSAIIRTQTFNTSPLLSWHSSPSIRWFTQFNNEFIFYSIAKGRKHGQQSLLFGISFARNRSGVGGSYYARNENGMNERKNEFNKFHGKAKEKDSNHFRCIFKLKQLLNTKHRSTSHLKILILILRKMK